MPRPLVLFAHGKESGPWGTKIEHLAAIARSRGYAVDSPDYASVSDPDARVEKLLALKPQPDGDLILVGSSMGGYVSTVACGPLGGHALFLMAPAFYLEGYDQQDPMPQCVRTTIVHGWDDDVVPVDHSIRFARTHGAELYLVASDHRLTSALPRIGKLFDMFLQEAAE